MIISVLSEKMKKRSFMEKKNNDQNNDQNNAQ